MIQHCMIMTTFEPEECDWYTIFANQITHSTPKLVLNIR